MVPPTAIPPAAQRYTEARMAEPTSDMLADLKLDTVDYQPNYDERPGMEEPTVLPGKFPNLLVNGSTGIAVGMACNLVPHNVREICDAIIKVIDNPEIGLAELMEIVPGPDFPTGGNHHGPGRDHRWILHRARPNDAALPSCTLKKPRPVKNAGGDRRNSLRDHPPVDRGSGG